MTLVEIMVAIAVAGLIAMAMVASAGSIFGARLVSTCNKMSGMVRYAYNLASLRGKVHRILFNMDEGSYQIEEVEEKAECVLVEEGEETKGKKDEPELPGGTAVKDSRVRTEKLPPGVKITGLFTRHNKSIVEEGQESVYFFPDGTAEKAFVWVSDGDDTFTVEVTSLRGNGLVHDEELEERELGKR